MLFNTYAFIFGFLPLATLLYFQLAKHSHALASRWLVACSLCFYAWWDVRYVLLLLTSIYGNYVLGKRLLHHRSYRLLVVGVTANLCLLGYYKYAHFFITTLDHLLATDWTLANTVLPLGISFFTFTQIAFLVDAYRGQVKQLNFTHYCLFVTYYPHLIAGPILHHQEMMPQFAKPSNYAVQWENIALGLTLFTLGLFKKVVFADGCAEFANPVFASAAHAETLPCLVAWGGALAYSLQLYFDFSGYSDMAIGISRLYGVRLPSNFNSPYQAHNIIDFWRRWHMTLSRFLRDYLYIPLGGGRKGMGRRFINLWLTMLLGGLWHGAGWTFIVWGGLHGLYLTINHAWQAITSTIKPLPHLGKSVAFGLSRMVTFTCVVIAWVFFRAESLSSALTMLQAMFNSHSLQLPLSWQAFMPMPLLHGLTAMGIRFCTTPDYLQGLLLGTLCVIVWFLPNTQRMLCDFSPTLDKALPASVIRWQASPTWLIITAILLVYALTDIGKASDFLYFQF